MAGTGVGGIKDSQGNYEILGKGDSQIGTRSGTLKTTVGDFGSLSTGRLYTTSLFSIAGSPDDIVTVSLQGFNVSTPSTLPKEYVHLQSGFNYLNAQVFQDGDSTLEGAGFRVEENLVSGSSQISSRVFGDAIILGSLDQVTPIFVPNRADSGTTQASSVAATTLVRNFSVSNGSTIDILLPFTCRIVDAWVVGLEAGNSIDLRRLPPVGPPDAVTTTLAGVSATSVVRATTITTSTFNTNSALPLFQTKLRAEFSGVGAITGLLCVSLIRVGEVS